MENLNLVKILRKCQKGTKLYSPLFGEVEFINVFEGGYLPIVVKATNSKGEEFGQYFNEYGVFINGYDDAECMLWPSKECRDWSNFGKK